MTDDAYRYERRNHLMGQMKNATLHNASQVYNEHNMRKQQKMDDLEAVYTNQARQNMSMNQKQLQNQQQQQQQWSQDSSQEQYQEQQHHQPQKQYSQQLPIRAHKSQGTTMVMSPSQQEEHQLNLTQRTRHSQLQCKREQILQHQNKLPSRHTAKHGRISSGTQSPHLKHEHGGDGDRNYSDAKAISSQSTGRVIRHMDTETVSVHRRSLKPKERNNHLSPISPLAMQYTDEAMNILHDTDSNVDTSHICDSSTRSIKSSKTIVSKSSKDLRKMVKSQCKLLEVIDEAIKNSNSSVPNKSESEKIVKDTPLITIPGLPALQILCNHCTEKLLAHTSERDSNIINSVGGKIDGSNCQPTETLTISVDEVVNSKVINPMIRKLQRMHVNNLREEMSLIEDLERLPHQVNEVYRAAIFKKE